MSPPTNTPESLEELLAAASYERRALPPDQVYSEDFTPFFVKWVDKYNLTPGVVPALIAADLYRHFTAWCAESGLEIPPVGREKFGRALRRLGLARGRTKVKGRDMRPYCLEGNAAAFFRAWLREHPSAPLGETAFQVHKKERKSES